MTRRLRHPQGAIAKRYFAMANLTRSGIDHGALRVTFLPALEAVSEFAVSGGVRRFAVQML